MTAICPISIKAESRPNSCTAKNVVMLVGFDTRTIYSDGLDVLWNDAGYDTELYPSHRPFTAHTRSERRHELRTG